MSATALRSMEPSRHDDLESKGLETKPRLRALPRLRPRSGPKLVHGVVAMAGLGAIVMAQLGLSVALADGALEIQSIQQQTSDAQLQQQAMSEQVAAFQSPQHLASTAQGFGMISSEQQHYISLASGEVTVGADAPGQAMEALNSAGVLYVPNELVQSQVPLEDTSRTAMEQQRDREAEGYPGMLQPAEGVAADD